MEMRLARKAEPYLGSKRQTTPQGLAFTRWKGAHRTYRGHWGQDFTERGDSDSFLSKCEVVRTS